MHVDERHCCDQMRGYVNEKCDEHPDPFDCPNRQVYYSARFDEYGIIVHDGGSSFLLIKFCPWCGAALPESKRDEWFDALAALGFDNPSEQDIPERFLSDAWHSQKSHPG